MYIIKTKDFSVLYSKNVGSAEVVGIAAKMDCKASAIFELLKESK